MSKEGFTIGLLGGGQLGQMMIEAAHRLGLKVAVLDPDSRGPAAQIADEVIVGAYNDLAALDRLAAVAQVFTTEFENVPADSLRWLSAHGPTYPSAEAVEVCQDRLLEKQFITAAGVRTAGFLPISEAADLMAAPDTLFPGILKTRRMGYDGKGQSRVATREEAIIAFEGMGRVPCILEERVALACEVSVILARTPDGDCEVFPVAQNHHEGGILATSLMPANITPALQQQARDAAASIALSLRYVGVLCVEFFVTQEGQLLANEMSPRPHNSGHATVECCEVSQFEQQARICAGMPLGSSALIAPSQMTNLLGDLWFPHGPDAPALEPDWSLKVPPGAVLHLYGKSEARVGRKMGHITQLLSADGTTAPGH